jgi:cysteine synthase A
MRKLGLETEVVDEHVRAGSVARFRELGIALPTFSQLAGPAGIPPGIEARLSEVGADDAHPLNLFRVHWNNSADRVRRVDVPRYLEIPSALSGVRARIVLLLGDVFPMIRAHKVLAAYGCLAPRVVTGQFDPSRHRAVWPSTGNYCRGGVAISRIMGCRGVAVLPEGMSRERFDWLEEWVSDPEDIVRTPGTESNVKEIYDKCAELEADPENVIFNQFSEFGNYLAHFLATGKAVQRVVEDLAAAGRPVRLRAYVSASGSGGTLAAGDYLKDRLGAAVVVAEALECPTLLANGFGEHNIQGIGDKHVPLIHNVMNTDFLSAVSERATDALFVLFNSSAGREYLGARRGIPDATIGELHRLGFSAICNMLTAIKAAKYLDLGENDLIVTVATDGAELYTSELEKISRRDYPAGFDRIHAAETFGEHLAGATTDHFLELTRLDRERIFNLGYFTWVEQQGVSTEEFTMRREQAFWLGLREIVPAWDESIEAFNRETGVRVD